MEWIRKFSLPLALVIPTSLGWSQEANSPAQSAKITGVSVQGQSAIQPQASVTDTVDSAKAADEESKPSRLFPQDGWLKISGWLNAGTIYNASQPASGFNGPAIAQFRDEFQFNQLYITAEHELPKECFGFGLRVDVLYGMDSFLTQARGLETQPDGSPHWNGNFYGTALPQAYVAFGNTDSNIKAGHFYSIIGYEQVPADGNFFYTRSYAHCFHEPFTVTGLLASHKLNDNWSVQASLHDGADAFDPVVDKVSFMGGVTYAPKDAKWKWLFAFTTGGEPTAVPTAFRNSTKYYTMLDFNPTDKFEFVLQHDLGYQLDGKAGGGTALWYSAAGYGYYKLTDKIKVGSRFEWFRDEDGTRVGSSGLPGNPNVGSFPGNFYEATIGFNWTPNNNLRIRPEARWDWFTGAGNPFDDGKKSNQFTLGVDAILKF